MKLEEFKKKLKDLHGDLFLIDEKTFIGLHKKADFFHKIHGNWKTTPATILQGHNHPQCAREKLRFINRESILNIVNDLKHTWGDLITIDKNTYVKKSAPAKFIHTTYGEWWARPCSVLNGVGHPKMTFLKKSKAKRISVNNIQSRIYTKHNGLISLDENTYVHTNIKAKFVDIDYGEWWALPYNVLAGMNHPKRGTLIRLKKAKQRVKHISEIKRLIKEKHGDSIQIVDSTYVNMSTKCKFIDLLHGEWSTTPGLVIYNNCGHPKGSLKKAAKTRLKFPAIDHWKTKEICYPVSSYEYATLLWLNKNQYDYDWQIPFITPFITVKNKKSNYIVDFYIKSGSFSNTFVEIKGTWAHKGKPLAITSRQKWEWFHSTHPNSELWMCSDLEKLGILVNGKPNLELIRS